MSKRVVGTIQIMEDGSAIASMRGQSPFALPPLIALDLQEAVHKQQRAVTRRLDYQRFLRERAIAAAYEAHLEVVRE